METTLESTQIGSQFPRVSHIPPFSDTRAGELAVKITRSTGLILDPWQSHVTLNGLGQDENGKWTSREVGCVAARQNGKGAIIMARELAGLFVYKEKLIIHTAHRVATSDDAFRKIVGLIRGTPDLYRQVKKIWTGSAKRGIETRDGCWLRFMARTGDSTRGLTANCLISDEAYGLTVEEQAALNFTVSAVPNHQIWYFSTPPLSAAESVPLYKLRERGVNKDPRLAWFDWSAPPDTNLDDKSVWLATNPALGIRIEMETVEAERNGGIPAKEFARERLCIWEEKAATNIIDLKIWGQLVDEDSQPSDDVAIAVDITPSRDYASIACYSVREDGIGHAELIDYREGTRWLVDALVALKGKLNPVAIGIDTKGPANTLLLDLAKVGITEPVDRDNPQRGDLAIPTAQEAAAACGQFVDAVNQRSFRHINQAELNVAVGGAKTRSLGDSWGWARKTSAVDISPLVAITVARWAYEARAHLIGQQQSDPGVWIF